MAVTFGLLLLPTLVAVGVGVDLARAYTAKLKFEAAFNNAAVALSASRSDETEAALRARVQGYLDIGNPSGAPRTHVEMRMSDPLQPVVAMVASAAVPTTVLQLAGVKNLNLHAAARIVRRHPPGSQAGSQADDSDDNDSQSEDGQRMWRSSRHGNWLREDWHR
ncbi:MAG TPA: hypothetical protein VF113_13230 [Stellaceae bacterium]